MPQLRTRGSRLEVARDRDGRQMFIGIVPLLRSAWAKRVLASSYRYITVRKCSPLIEATVVHKIVIKIVKVEPCPKGKILKALTKIKHILFDADG